MRLDAREVGVRERALEVVHAVAKRRERLAQLLLGAHEQAALLFPFRSERGRNLARLPPQTAEPPVVAPGAQVADLAHAIEVELRAVEIGYGRGGRCQEVDLGPPQVTDPERLVQHGPAARAAKPAIGGRRPQPDQPSVHHLDAVDGRAERREGAAQIEQVEGTIGVAFVHVDTVVLVVPRLVAIDRD